MLGDMSEIMVSAFPPSSSLRRSTVSGLVMSPRNVATPSRGSMCCRSTPTTFPFGPTRSCATCSQPPGAAPRSATAPPGGRTLKRSSICMSLNEALER